MSDRYHGSAYRSRGPPRDDRRYAPRHHRDEHGYADARPYGVDPRDTYSASYYAEPRGYSDRPPPQRVHKAIPPPRPWDYSRRPLPRNEHERMELEREREAWEAKEEERYRQRMAERERERDRDRGQHASHGGWEREYDVDERMYRPGADAYDRERARHADHGPVVLRRPRSRSPGTDPRYEQRGSWSRASVGSSEGRDRELDRLAAAPSTERPEVSRYPDDGYPPRRSPPPPTSASHLDTPEASRFRAAPERPGSPRGTPRGPGPASRPPAESGSGFISTPPTGPRASRGGPLPFPSPAFRGREGSGSTTLYTPGSDRDREANSYFGGSNARFARPGRDGPPSAGAYRGGHPSFGRGRRDTNPYDSAFAATEDDAGYHGYGGGGGHAVSSPHEASPFSPSTSTPGGGAHLTAPRLSRTSSSQTPTVPTSATLPTGPAQAGISSPSTAQQPPLAPTPHIKICPELDAELESLQASRTAFISNYVLGAKRAAIRSARMQLKNAELDYSTASSRRHAAERALDVARETADAYSLEENRKEELQRFMAQQLQQQQPPAQAV